MDLNRRPAYHRTTMRERDDKRATADLKRRTLAFCAILGTMWSVFEDRRVVISALMAASSFTC